MRRFAVLAILLMACSPADTESSSTSSSTSVEPGSTTTTAVVTTTTSLATTTSVPVATTTTQPLLEGNWAGEPLVVSGFGALGWWDGSAWVQVDEATPLPVAGGEDYQVAALGFEGILTGGAPELLCDPLLIPGVALSQADLLGEWPGPYGVAISAPWELTPHLVESIDDDGTYAAFARELLAERGLTVANPKIKQLLRVDLEGDGVNEVIVVAEAISGIGLFPSQGDYSIAFLRKVVQGSVETAILGESVIVDPEGAFLVAFAIGGVADLNGDGQMEVVVDAAYYEGLGIDVWEYVNDDIGMLPAIQVGCGA